MTESLRRPAWVSRVAAWVQAGVAPNAIPARALAWCGGVALVAFVVLTVAVAYGATLALDTRMELAVHALATPVLDVDMEALTLLGTIPVVVAIVLAAGALLARARRRFEAVALGALMAGQGVVDDIVKLAMHRPRPLLFPHAAARGFSFPSGHAMTTLCLAGALLYFAWPRLSTLLRWAVALVVVAIVAGVGVSRMYLGVHFPSDVVGGWLAGIAWLGAAPWLIRHAAAYIAASPPAAAASTQDGPDAMVR